MANDVVLHGGVHPPMALRCPVCAGPVHPYHTLRFGEEMRCGSCRRSFDLLPGNAAFSDDGRGFIMGSGSSWGLPPGSASRSPERATLDEVESDPAYRRRNHRRRVRS